MYVCIFRHIQALLYSRTSESVLCGQSAQSSARAETGLAVIRMMEMRRGKKWKQFNSSLQPLLSKNMFKKTAGHDIKS